MRLENSRPDRLLRRSRCDGKNFFQLFLRCLLGTHIFQRAAQSNVRVVALTGESKGAIAYQPYPRRAIFSNNN
jgi:hypothetical protein